MLRKGTPRRGKVRALLAGGLVLGVGSVATLAAWTDTEWVWGGGQGDGDNLGTSTFEMEQNTTGDPDGWEQQESAPGGQLRFSVNATNLVPGDTVYAPLQLRVIAGSDGGVVTLDGAQAFGSTDQALFDALVYEAKTGRLGAEHRFRGHQLRAGGCRGRRHAR
jgi:predicted ribosomally synthesized peptide with SipW-like signal peptide